MSRSMLTGCVSSLSTDVSRIFSELCSSGWRVHGCGYVRGSGRRLELCLRDLQIQWRASLDFVLLALAMGHSLFRR
jgi:hypothetical protein